MDEKNSGVKGDFQKEGNTTVKNDNTVQADTKAVTSTLDQQTKPSIHDGSYQLPPHVTLMIGGAIATTIVVSWINNYWQSKRQNKQFEHDSKKHITEIDSEFKKQEALFQHERRLANEVLLKEKRDLLFHSVKDYVNYHFSLSTQFTFNITSNVPADNIQKLKDLHDKYDVEKRTVELDLYVNNYFFDLSEPLK